jgi:hypothetical protein
MPPLILWFILFSCRLLAQDGQAWPINQREGKSLYTKSVHQRAMKRVLKKISKDELIVIFQNIYQRQESTKGCSFDLNQELSSELSKRGIDADLKGVIYLLRDLEQIDDVTSRILLFAHEVKSTYVFEKDEDDLIFPFDVEKTAKQMSLITSFEKRFLSKNCLDEAYRSLYTELSKTDKKFQLFELEALSYMAMKEGKISAQLFLALEQARLNRLDKPQLTLASYQQKLRTLRIQYPLPEVIERSDFVSSPVKKLKMGRRQKLFENYSDLQIILMGNVIKNLRQRLEYDAVEITGFRNGRPLETMVLDPMERFRFAIKALRKEMSLLSLNTYFNGRTPDYIDLLVASYELGIIASAELEVIASLEEIWSPKKTFWDKANIWVRTLSSVATITIPPPFGFIPAIALVVIEATAINKKELNTNDPTSLF